MLNILDFRIRTKYTRNL